MSYTDDAARVVSAMTDPKNHDAYSVRAALDCTVRVLSRRWCMAFVGDKPDDDFDAICNLAAADVADAKDAALYEAITSFFHIGVWKGEVAAGDTYLGYEEWLLHKHEEYSDAW